METEDTEQFVAALAQSCARALGDAILSVIVHGSLTLGGYVPGRSDVDVLVIVEEPLTDAQQVGVVQAVVEDTWLGAPTRADVRFIPRAVTLTAVRRPPLDLGIALAPQPYPALRVEARIPHERDVVPELSVCRAHGRVVAGMSPRDLIAEVPPEWVTEVGDAQLADWEALPFEPRYDELMVFTACRVWQFVEAGVHSSKAAAAEWVLQRAPDLHAVRAALAKRHGDVSATIAEHDVRELLRAARERTR